MFQGRLESHGPGKVVEVGRGCHHRLVDLGKLLLGAVTLDAHLVAQIIETEGEIDLRGFLGIDPAVTRGYDNLRYKVHIKGNGTKEQFAEIHEAVMATSPNFYNLSRPVALKPTLVVE